MFDHPTFSIVTPHRNYGRFLGTAIESVRLQASENLSIEHLVIDAQSNDGSVEWLRNHTCTFTSEHQGEISAPHYTLKWLSEPDQGQTDAINKGLRMSSGSYVCWLNADEYYLPGALETVANTFHNHPEADLVYGEPLFVDNNGNPIRVKRNHRFDAGILLYYGCYIASCSTFWKRRVLEKGHYLDNFYRVTMDFEYWVRLYRAGFRFQFVPETIGAFTWHADNVSSVLSAERRKERLKVQFIYAPKRFRNERRRTQWLDLMARIYRLKRQWLLAKRILGG